MRNLLSLFALSAVWVGTFALGGCSATMRSEGSGIPSTPGASDAARSHGVGIATFLDPVRGLGRTFAPTKPASAKRSSWFAPGLDAKVTHLLYLANWYGSGVDIYSESTHNPVGFIATYPYQPNSVHVGGDGNIWVALNTDGADPSIYVYKPGETTPFRTLSGVTNIPVSIAPSKNGTVYVTDENLGVGELIVFAPGSDTPTSTLSDANATCCGWVAVDHRGNVFFTYESQSGHTGAIDEFVRGKGKPVSLGITLTTFPGGIEVLKDDSLVVVEQGIPDFDLAARIDTFPKGATQPSSVISGNPNCDNWVGPALDKKERTVFVGSTLQSPTICSLNGAWGAVEQYSYPSGTLLSEFNGGLTNQGGWTLLVPALNPPAAGQ